MPGVDVVERARLRVEQAEEDGGEGVAERPEVGGLVDARDVLVRGVHGLLEHGLGGVRRPHARGTRALGVGAEQAAEEGHEEGRPHALPAHVGDDEPNAADGEPERVVEVARDLGGRAEAGVDLPAGGA